MSDTKHTSGPWKTHKNNMIVPEIVEGRTLRIVYKENGLDVAYVLDTLDGDNGNANARLIAAAPELLEAAKDTAESLKFAITDMRNADVSPWKVELRVERLRALEAAIAKTEGDAP